MVFAKEIFYSILEKGVDPRSKFDQQRRVKLVNLMSLFNVVAFASAGNFTSCLLSTFYFTLPVTSNLVVEKML